MWSGWYSYGVTTWARAVPVTVVTARQASMASRRVLERFIDGALHWRRFAEQAPGPGPEPHIPGHPGWARQARCPERAVRPGRSVRQMRPAARARAELLLPARSPKSGQMHPAP